MKNDIYAELYDIVKQNIEKAGGELQYSQDAFLSITKMDNFVFDYQKAKHLDNHSFFFSSYHTLLHTHPSQQTLLDWEKHICSMHPDHFKIHAMRSILGNAPAILGTPSIINNDLCHINGGVLPPPPRKYYNRLLNFCYEKIYQKSPPLIKTAIRVPLKPVITGLRTIKSKITGKSEK